MARGRARKTDGNEYLVRRLDAIIRLLLETMYAMKITEFNQTIAVQTLNSVGLTPTEIAAILGKKSPTDVAPYLYKKKLGKGGR
jgi:hypothetical protein